MYNNIIIGIDQSYKNTGICVMADGSVKLLKSLRLEKVKNNSLRRYELKNYLRLVLDKVIQEVPSNKHITCIIERIRLQSQGFINIDYIKSIGALNSVIVDIMQEYGVQTFSVDTRCWKSRVVGTSKPMPNNFGVPDEKWPTVKMVIEHGLEAKILIQHDDKSRKNKGTFMRFGTKYSYNDDAADSYGIALFGYKFALSELKNYPAEPLDKLKHEC